MAGPLDHSEVWVSPNLIGNGKDTNINHYSNKNVGLKAQLDASLCFPSEFPYEFDLFGVNSALVPPLDPVPNLVETETADEDDFLARLAKKTNGLSLSPKSTLSGITADPDDFLARLAKKTNGLSLSPKSTLSGIGSWSGRSLVSSDGGSNCPSQVPSPPTTPFDSTNTNWDVIYAAAGHVARMKLYDQGPRSHKPNHLHQKNIPAELYGNRNVHRHCPQSHSSVLSNLGSYYGRPAKPNLMTQQQGTPIQNGICSRPVCLPLPDVPSLSQPRGFGVGGAFGRGSGLRRGCSGTGVFLPRHHWNPPPESPKKTSCCPVLLPNKGIHALNLNLDLDGMDGYIQSRLSVGLLPDYGGRNSFLAQAQAQQRRNMSPAPDELRLPQEWTY